MMLIHTLSRRSPDLIFIFFLSLYDLLNGKTIQVFVYRPVFFYKRKFDYLDIEKRL